VITYSPCGNIDLINLIWTMIWILSFHLKWRGSWSPSFTFVKLCRMDFGYLSVPLWQISLFYCLSGAGIVPSIICMWLGRKGNEIDELWITSFNMMLVIFHCRIICMVANYLDCTSSWLSLGLLKFTMAWPQLEIQALRMMLELGCMVHDRAYEFVNRSDSGQFPFKILT
jgi:hypothetical protein